ncbi:MAG: hypothetical protein ACYC5G_01200 [Candidatus Doudnabacteria bacterium]
MSEEQMRTSEHELRVLIEESKALIDKNQTMIQKGEDTFLKMNRTLKGFVATAIPVVLAFFWTFYDNGKTMAKMEESKVSKTELEDKYPTKSDVVFLQNNIYDMNNAAFTLNTAVSEQRMEDSYSKALKQFLHDVSRSATKNQQ